MIGNWGANKGVGQRPSLRPSPWAPQAASTIRKRSETGPEVAYKDQIHPLNASATNEGNLNHGAGQGQTVGDGVMAPSLCPSPRAMATVGHSDRNMGLCRRPNAGVQAGGVHLRCAASLGLSFSCVPSPNRRQWAANRRCHLPKSKFAHLMGPKCASAAK